MKYVLAIVVHIRMCVHIYMIPCYRQLKKLQMDIGFHLLLVVQEPFTGQ